MRVSYLSLEKTACVILIFLWMLDCKYTKKPDRNEDRIVSTKIRKDRGLGVRSLADIMARIHVQCFF